MYDVLLLDDNPQILRGLRDTIDWQKFEMRVVGVCTSGEEALEILRERSVDIALVDIQLPGMSGLNFARQIMSMNAGMKVIIISAYGEFSFAQECIEIGVKRYLLKPIDPDELEKVLLDTKKELELSYDYAPDQGQRKQLFERVIRTNVERLNKEIEQKLNQVDRAGLADLLGQMRMLFPDDEETFLDALPIAFSQARTEKLRSLTTMREQNEFLIDMLLDERVLNSSANSALAIRCAVRYIDEHYMSELNMADLARMYHIQPAYFSMLFRKEIGESFTNYLIHIRMERAISYLRAGYSASQTADMVGYENYKSFYKSFKKYWGIGPAEAGGRKG